MSKEKALDYNHFKTGVIYLDESTDQRNRPGLTVSKSYIFVTPDIEVYHWINQITYYAIEESHMNVIYMAVDDDPDNFRISFNRWVKRGRKDVFIRYMKEGKLGILNLIEGGGTTITKKYAEGIYHVKSNFNLAEVMYSARRLVDKYSVPVPINVSERGSETISYGPLFILNNVSALINAIGFNRVYRFLFSFLSKIISAPDRKTALITFISRNSLTVEDLTKLSQLFDSLFQIASKEYLGNSRLYFKVDVISELPYTTPWIPYIYFPLPAGIVFLEPRAISELRDRGDILIEGVD